MSDADRSEPGRKSEKPRAVFKVGVYELINSFRSNQFNKLEAGLLDVINYPLRVRFEDNPYHWGLAAIAKSGEVDLNFTDSISEFATELSYAWKHRIPPELLIGFIYQVGGCKQIKARLDHHQHEDWYREHLPWDS